MFPYVRALLNGIDDDLHQHLLDSTSTVWSRALTLSCCLPHAGDWLNVVPSPSLGLHLHDKEFRSYLRYWLPYRCPQCGSSADIFGDHQDGCGGNGDCITRHNAARDVLYSAAQAAALGPIKEAPSLLPNSSARPADILLPTWSPRSSCSLGCAQNLTTLAAVSRRGSFSTRTCTRSGSPT